jgi:hypothetical protein
MKEQKINIIMNLTVKQNMIWIRGSKFDKENLLCSKNMIRMLREECYGQI